MVMSKMRWRGVQNGDGRLSVSSVQSVSSVSRKRMGLMGPMGPMGPMGRAKVWAGAVVGLAQSIMSIIVHSVHKTGCQKKHENNENNGIGQGCPKYAQGLSKIVLLYRRPSRTAGAKPPSQREGATPEACCPKYARRLSKMSDP